MGYCETVARLVIKNTCRGEKKLLLLKLGLDFHHILCSAGHGHGGLVKKMIFDIEGAMQGHGDFR